MKTFIEPVLPNTLYLLLKTALTDFYKLKKQLAMGINMNVWYSPKNLSSNDTCLVCLAGAIIANMVKDTLLEKKNLSPHVFFRGY